MGIRHLPAENFLRDAVYFIKQHGYGMIEFLLIRILHKA